MAVKLTLKMILTFKMMVVGVNNYQMKHQNHNQGCFVTKTPPEHGTILSKLVTKLLKLQLTMKFVHGSLLLERRVKKFQIVKKPFKKFVKILKKLLNGTQLVGYTM